MSEEIILLKWKKTSKPRIWINSSEFANSITSHWNYCVDEFINIVEKMQVQPWVEIILHATGPLLIAFGRRAGEIEKSDVRGQGGQRFLKDVFAPLSIYWIL